MKIITMVAGIFIALFTLQIYAGEQTPYPSTSEQPRTQTEMDDLPDSEILAYLMAINEGEMAAARDAIQKNADPMIREYAQHLFEDHAKSLEDTKKLAVKIDIRAQDNASISRMRDNGSAIRADLSQLQGGAFVNAFTDFMVRNHVKALEIIDNQLLRDAKNVRLQDHLKATRITVAEHLAEAEKIQHDISSASPR